MNGSAAIDLWPWLYALIWAVVHSIWQAGLLALILWVALQFTRRWPATRRYGLACVVGGAAALVPIGTFIYLNAGTDWHVVAPLPSLATAPAKVDPATYTPPAPAVPSPLTSTAGRVLAKLGDWIIAGYLLAVAIVAVSYIGGYLVLQRLVIRRSQPISNPPTDLLQVAQQMSVADVEFRRGTLFSGPAVVGVRRPKLLFPDWLLGALGVRELQAVTAHELAHVRRRDNAVNAVQVVLETLLVFNPFFRWISNRIRDEREHCCDEWAARVLGDAKFYARTLARVADESANLPPLAIGLGDGPLTQRVARILGVHARRTRLSSASAAGVLLILLGLGLFGARLLSGSAALADAQYFQQTRPFPQRVHEILNVPMGGGDGALAALEQLTAHEVTRETVTGPLGQRFAQSVSGALSPDWLIRQIITHQSSTSQFQHEFSPTWRWGSTARRQRLVRELWAVAMENKGSASATVVPRLYGRAALLLAAQETHTLGPALVQWIINHEGADQLVGIDDNVSSALRYEIAAFRRTTRIFLNLVAELNTRIGDPQGANVDRAVELMQQIHTIAPARLDLHWYMANQIWLLRGDPRGAEVARRVHGMLANLAPLSPELNRWMNQAISIPPPGAPGGTSIRVVTDPEQIKKFRVYRPTTRRVPQTPPGDS